MVETPRDRNDGIADAAAITPSARIIRANSAPQKRLEESLSIPKASRPSESSPAIEVVSPSAHSSTTQSSRSSAAAPR